MSKQTTQDLESFLSPLEQGHMIGFKLQNNYVLQHAHRGFEVAMAIGVSNSGITACRYECNDNVVMHVRTIDVGEVHGKSIEIPLSIVKDVQIYELENMGRSYRAQEKV